MRHRRSGSRSDDRLPSATGFLADPLCPKGRVVTQQDSSEGAGQVSSEGAEQNGSYGAEQIQVLEGLDGLLVEMPGGE